MSEDKELLELLRIYLEESEDSKVNITPIRIDGSLCIKCDCILAGYCVTKNMDAPYTKYCDEYRPKVIR